MNEELKDALGISDRDKFGVPTLLLLILLLIGILVIAIFYDRGGYGIHKQVALDLLRSNEILAQADGYSYTWTRILYRDGEPASEEKTRVSFVVAKKERIMEYKSESDESRAVYFSDRAYSYDGEVWGLLCLAPEECRAVAADWEMNFTLDYDTGESEQVVDFSVEEGYKVIHTCVSYEGGSTRWTYLIDSESGRMLEVRGEDFDEAGKMFGRAEFVFSYEKPDIAMDFIRAIENGDWSDARTCTLVTAPGTENEKTQQYRIPQGFAFFFLEQEGYRYYEDIEGRTPAEWEYPPYGDIVLYRIADKKEDGAAVTGSNEETHAPLETANYGVMTGSTAEIFIGKTYPDATISTYSSIADAFLALGSGRTDYVLTAYTTALNAVRNNSLLEIYQMDVIEEESSIAVSKENPQLLADIDSVLNLFREDGTLDEIVAHWTTQGQDYVIADMPVSDRENGTLRVAIAADREPMCFVLNGEYKGLDCELIERIAAKLGMTVEYQNMPFGSLVAALASGKADVIISNMTATDERRESVDFTQAYFSNPQVLVSRKGQEDADTEFAAARYGIISVTIQNWLAETYPNASVFMYPAAADAFLALETGKVDFCVASRASAQYMGMLDPNIVIVQDHVLDEACSIAVAKSNQELRDALDEALAELVADGTLDGIISRWTGTAPDEYAPVKVPEGSGSGGVLRVAISPDVTPICFVLDGEYAGIDIELIEWLAYALDKKVEYINMQFDALLPALESGKADVALSDIVDTPERRKSVNFTEAYFDNPQVIAAYRGSTASTAQKGTDVGSTKEKEGFLNGLAASFERTFITESRWKMILSGLEITVIISVFSGAVGSVIGFGICMFRRSRIKPVALLTAVFIRMIQGTPIVVLLMILYYVIFASFSNISAVLVAVIGFSVNFGVYVSEMMRTGIDAVEKGQIEAATALGYNGMQTFCKVTFPQAARHFLPVLKGEFISMVKMTSVVGYIAVQDLTKVSDIIRSRTLEAFFPLIATAVIYFVIANILTMTLSFIEIRLDPKRRKGILKGVVQP